MDKKFEDTVEKITEQYGTKGFTAKKTAAADILGDDIKAAKTDFGSGDDVQIATAVLDKITNIQTSVETSRDPGDTKETLKAIKDVKQVIANLNKSKDLDEDQTKKLDAIIKKTEKNVKKAGKGGAFGKANETFLSSLTESLNPLTALGNFAGAAGATPLEGYFNSLGDSLNEKVKGALGIGASEDSQNMTREIQKDGRAEIDTADQMNANDNASVLTPDGQTSKAGIESGAAFKASDLLVPEMSLMKRTSIRLGRALGLTDQTGKSYLSQLLDVMKPDPSSRGEESDKPELGALPGGDDVEPEEPKKKGGIMGLLSGLGGAAAGGIGAGLKALSMGIRSLAMSIMMLAAPPALIGLAAFTLAIIGIGAAMRLAAPAIEAIVPIFTKVAEVIGDVFMKGMEMVPVILDKIGGVITSVGDAISGVVTAVFGSIADTVERLSALSGKDLLSAAGGIAAIAGSLALFGGAGLLAGIGSFFGGGPLDSIEKLDSTEIDKSAQAVDKFGNALQRLDKNISDFGGSDAPRILKDFSKSIEGFGDSLPSAVDVIKMTAFGLSFSKLQGTAKDFVQNMQIIASPSAPSETDAMNDAQRQSQQSGGKGSGASLAVNNGGNVTNSSSVVNNTTTTSNPRDIDFDYYAFRGINVHA